MEKKVERKENFLRKQSVIIAGEWETSEDESFIIGTGSNPTKSLERGKSRKILKYIWNSDTSMDGFFGRE